MRPSHPLKGAHRPYRSDDSDMVAYCAFGTEHDGSFTGFDETDRVVRPRQRQQVASLALSDRPDRARLSSSLSATVPLESATDVIGFLKRPPPSRLMYVSSATCGENSRLQQHAAHACTLWILDAFVPLLSETWRRCRSSSMRFEASAFESSESNSSPVSRHNDSRYETLRVGHGVPKLTEPIRYACCSTPDSEHSFSPSGQKDSRDWWPNGEARTNPAVLQSIDENAPEPGPGVRDRRL
jgi:hypothetical protein